MLTEIDRNIWTAAGPTVSFLGFPYPTRMAVVRLTGGDLWIWSPIALTEELVGAVEQLGRVAHLVAPNKLHHLYLGDWKRRWPEARLYAPPGLAKRRTDLRFDAELGDSPDMAWAGEIDQVIFHGSFAMEEVVFFHRPSSTVLFTDLIQRFDPETLKGWRRIFMILDGLVGPEGSTPREWRLSFWNRRAARRALRKVVSWNPNRLIIAHGECTAHDALNVVARSLRWLGKPEHKIALTPSSRRE
jgi:hypothetical protein